MPAISASCTLSRERKQYHGWYRQASCLRSTIVSNAAAANVNPTLRARQSGCGCKASQSLSKVGMKINVDMGAHLGDQSDARLDFNNFTVSTALKRQNNGLQPYMKDDVKRSDISL